MSRMFMTHLVFSTPNIKRTVDFYVEKLGFNAVEYLNSYSLYKDDIEIVLTDSKGKPGLPKRERYGKIEKWKKSIYKRFD